MVDGNRRQDFAGAGRRGRTRCPAPKKKEERQMNLTNHDGLRASGVLGLLLIELCLMGLGSMAHAQTFSTTTVQGTVYLANGQPGTGTLVVSWPSFTTANGQVVAADSETVPIAPDGFVSVSLAPNQGSTPAGLVLHGDFLHERRVDEHPVLGGSGGDIGDAGTGAGAVDAVDAGRAGGEQDVCGSGDCVPGGRNADDNRCNDDRAADVVLRSDDALAGGRQALCGYANSIGGAADGRDGDGAADGDQAGGGLPGGPVCGSGFRGQAGSMPERAECDAGRNVRCAEFFRDAGDGIEPDNFDGECDGAAAVRDDFDGESGRGDGGNEECVATRMRTARREHGERQPGRDGFLLLGNGSDGAGGRPDLCGGHAGFSSGQRGDQYHVVVERQRERIRGLSHAGDGSGKLVFSW